MVAESKAKWIGFRLSFGMYSFGGAGRGAGAGAGAGAATTGGGGAGAAGAGAGAGGGAGAGAATGFGAATGRFAQAETKRSPTMSEKRMDRSMNVRTVCPPLLDCNGSATPIRLTQPTQWDVGRIGSRPRAPEGYHKSRASAPCERGKLLTLSACEFLSGGSDAG